MENITFENSADKFFNDVINEIRSIVREHGTAYSDPPLYHLDIEPEEIEMYYWDRVNTPIPLFLVGIWLTEDNTLSFSGSLYRADSGSNHDLKEKRLSESLFDKCLNLYALHEIAEALRELSDYQ